jgi:hypothetical protein
MAGMGLFFHTGSSRTTAECYAGACDVRHINWRSEGLLHTAGQPTTQAVNFIFPSLKIWQFDQNGHF